MKPKITVQVQAVFFRNEPNQMIRSIEAIDSAARKSVKNDVEVSLTLGDASEKPVFSRQMWSEIKQNCQSIKRMQYQVFGQNTGYGYGNNLLAKDVKTDYLMIMNPEVIVSPNVIEVLLEVFRDPDAGIAEARQIPVEHPKAFDPVTFETSWASGACFMIPTALFHEMNGFDSDHFFMYCEDVDLSWRIRLSGKKVLYQSLAGVFHARRLSREGRNQPSQTEIVYTVLSEALLAYKWFYQEYAWKRLQIAAEKNMPGGPEALDVFLRKEKAESLPVSVDPDHRIAKITQDPETGGLLFTEHRYSL